VIVGPQLVVDKFLDLVEPLKQMMGKPVIANVTLEVSILLGLAGLYEINADSVSGCLCQGHRADVLQTVIAADSVRFAPPLDDAVK